MATDGGTPRPTYVNKELEANQKEELIQLLREYKDVFAWNYDEMPGIDKDLVEHNLNISPGMKPVKQAPRNYAPEVETQIKEEIKKLLEVGFIKPIQHPTWLSSIVPVKKSNGQLRICVDFRDLNKACPKDMYPLPNIDTLVDATANHEICLSWMGLWATIR